MPTYVVEEESERSEAGRRARYPEAKVVHVDMSCCLRSMAAPCTTAPTREAVVRASVVYIIVKATKLKGEGTEGG